MSKHSSSSLDPEQHWAYTRPFFLFTRVVEIEWSGKVSMFINTVTDSLVGGAVCVRGVRGTLTYCVTHR